MNRERKVPSDSVWRRIGRRVVDAYISAGIVLVGIIILLLIAYAFLPYFLKGTTSDGFLYEVDRDFLDPSATIVGYEGDDSVIRIPYLVRRNRAEVWNVYIDPADKNPNVEELQIDTSIDIWLDSLDAFPNLHTLNLLGDQLIFRHWGENVAQSESLKYLLMSDDCFEEYMEDIYGTEDELTNVQIYNKEAGVLLDEDGSCSVYENIAITGERVWDIRSYGETEFLYTDVNDKMKYMEFSDCIMYCMISEDEGIRIQSVDYSGYYEEEETVSLGFVEKDEYTEFPEFELMLKNEDGIWIKLRYHTSDAESADEVRVYYKSAGYGSVLTAVSDMGYTE